MVFRDQGAEFAASHLKAVLFVVEIRSHAIDVRAELVDIVHAGLGGQLGAGLILQIRQLFRVFFLDLLGLEAGLAKFAFGQFHFVGHDAELALKLRVGVLSLGQTLIENLFVFLKLFALGG